MAQYNLGRVMGLSAYELAVQNGYSGTEQEWLASLKGTNGTNGTNGVDGVSPVASVERNLADTGAVITITDATGTTTATVYDGETPSLTGYATETYVDNAVGAIDVPTATSDLTNDSGFITSSDLSGYAQTSSLATVATTGDYDDLTNKPTIPDVSDLATETYVDNAVAGITVPTAISDLTNDSGFVTANDLATVATSGDYDDLTNKPTIPAAPGIATAQTAGLVKPDGSTITIDANGTITSAAGLSPDSRNNVLLPAVTGSENTVASGVGIYSNVLFGQKNRIIGSGYSSGNVIGGYNNSIYAGTANSNISGSGHSITLNVGTQQAPQSVIVGGNSNVLKGNRNGIIVGTGLTATGWNQAIFGNYNSDTTAKLVVGIGEDSNNKADGFKVTSTGAGVFASTVQATDFLDANGNSIIGSGGDSLPTINSGDAGKALVVNNGETGVEWATVGGGSAPVDPAHSSGNVLTGAGSFASAWTTVMGSDRIVYRDYNFEENPIEVVDDVYEFTANENIYAEVITFDLIGNKEGAEGGYSGMLYKTANNAWTTGDGCYTLTTAYSNSVYTYTITRYPEYLDAAFFMRLDEITHVIFNVDKLRGLMVGAEFAGDFPLPIGQTRWKDNGETERTLSIGLDEIKLTDNHCAESPYNVERVEETNSISISAADGISVSYESQIDDITQQTEIYSNGIYFSQIEPDPENPGDTITTNWNWNTGMIQLTDQLTGDIYQLTIENGQIVLTDTSR